MSVHRLIHGDSVEKLIALENDSIDALVTDPPAAIGFMNMSWDHHKGGRVEWIAWLSAIMRECYRVMKPGAHGLVWALPRTSHWTGTALEDAGFEVRDVITHLQGQGFPKSQNIFKESKKKGLVCECEKTEAETNLSDLRDTISTQKPDCAKQGEVLLESLSGKMEVSRSINKKSHGVDSESRTIGMDRGFEEILPSKDVGIYEPSVERGELYRAGKRLSNDKESESPEIEGERICSGTHPNSGADARASINGDGSRPSHQPQPIGQQTGESSDLREPQRALGETPQGGLCCSKCGKLKEAANGLGTALKPSCEFWYLIRKPLSEKTVAANVLRWGTGALNIDSSRVPFQSNSDRASAKPQGTATSKQPKDGLAKAAGVSSERNTFEVNQSSLGRFPSNLILSCSCDHDQHHLFCPVHMLDEQSLAGGMHGAGHSRDGSTAKVSRNYAASSYKLPANRNMHRLGDSGGASRFYYVAKVSSSERNAGLEGMESRQHGSLGGGAIKSLKTSAGNPRDCRNQNHHPTVKPLKLMRYLCKLITPPGGIILDPFMGSGSTGLAAKQEGFGFIGIEKEPDYFQIAEKRIEATP